jgi:hypothetical protein
LPQAPLRPPAINVNPKSLSLRHKIGARRFRNILWRRFRLRHKATRCIIKGPMPPGAQSICKRPWPVHRHCCIGVAVRAIMRARAAVNQCGKFSDHAFFGAFLGLPAFIAAVRAVFKEMATACFCGLPAFISLLMFLEMEALE